MEKLIKAGIIKINAVSAGIFRIFAESAGIASVCAPGQFIEVKCGENSDMVLRRPFSISGADRSSGIFDFSFQVRGKGTEYLSHLKQGETLDIIGPLGTGFALMPGNKHVTVVAGGIGIFPLIFLINELKKADDRIDLKVYTGIRDGSGLELYEMIAPICENVCLTTEDGCKGIKGYVTGPLEDGLQESKPDIIYACGPVPMLKAVAAAAGRHGVKCQISLEERMGCGIGACMVCSCKTKSGADGWKYSRVCKDGPVFWSSEVVF